VSAKPHDEEIVTCICIVSRHLLRFMIRVKKCRALDSMSTSLALLIRTSCAIKFPYRSACKGRSDRRTFSQKYPMAAGPRLFLRELGECDGINSTRTKRRGVGTYLVSLFLLFFGLGHSNRRLSLFHFILQTTPPPLARTCTSCEKKTSILLDTKIGPTC
jgi:hypothetical protein